MTLVPTHTTMLVASIGWKRRYVKQNDNACLEIKTETLCRCYILKKMALANYPRKGKLGTCKGTTLPSDSLYNTTAGPAYSSYKLSPEKVIVLCSWE